MTERRKFGEFKQNRFITVIESDNSCGIEDLMRQKKYKGFREKDYHKLCNIREELNQLFYDNEKLKQKIKSITEILNEDIGYIDSFKKIEEVIEKNKRLIRTIGDLSEPVMEMDYDKPVTVCKDGVEYDIDVLIYDDDKLVIVVGAEVIE